MATTLTVSYSDDHSPADLTEHHCYLVLSLHCQRPAQPGLRIPLPATEELRIGRSVCQELVHEETTSQLRIPDRWMSSLHARLTCENGRWWLVDEGAKNGCYVNGTRQQRALLRDGDIIELGSCVFLLRTGVTGPPGPTFGAGDPPGLHTHNSSFANRLTGLRRVAPSDVPAILLGESGTGKEVTAHALHELSGRTGKFLAVNCGALPRELLESELFGHRKGAFSGAVTDSEGLIRAADGGTLFLDEVAELPLASQIALLRVLQENEVRAVGDTTTHRVDVRIVAATHQDLRARVANGSFREDLYARLAGYTLTLPPLRERTEDLGMLIQGLLYRVAGDRADRLKLQRSAARALFAYHFPRNIRELEHALAAAVALCEDDEISIYHLPEPIRRALAPATSSPRVASNVSDADDDDDGLRTELVRQLRAHQGNISAVARAMNKARVQIRRWCKRMDIDATEFRNE